MHKQQKEKKSDTVPIELHQASSEVASCTGYEKFTEAVWRLCAEKPYVRKAEFWTIVLVSNSRAYEMWNPNDPSFDQTFPVGFRLFETECSPRVWHRHEAIAWVELKANKKFNSKGIKK